MSTIAIPRAPSRSKATAMAFPRLVEVCSSGELLREVDVLDDFWWRGKGGFIEWCLQKMKIYLEHLQSRKHT